MHQQAHAARNAALGDLDTHWGELYDLAVTHDGWVAKRLDNNRSLLAATAGELRAMITADHGSEPVRCHRCPDAGGLGHE
jgi:hypothetical protein